MIRPLALFCFIWLFSYPLAGQTYFLSDGLGMKISPLEDIPNGEGWYLEIFQDGGTTLETLYRDGLEQKRWEISFPDSESGEYSEYYFYQKSLREIREYDRRDTLLSEQLFDSRGDLLEYRLYRYDQDKRLENILFLSEEGDVEKTYSLIYRDRGSLKGITLPEPSGGKAGNLVWRSSDPESEDYDRILLEEGDRAYLYTYEGWNLAVRSVFRGDKEVEKSLFSYDSRGQLEKETVWDYQDNILRIFFYDSTGQVVLENLFLNGILKQSITRTYREDMLIRYQERKGKENLIWEYQYSSDSKDPEVSILYRNGQLVKKIIREETSDREILYRDNRAVYETLIPREETEGDDS